jgi:hypothetical protein
VTSRSRLKDSQFGPHKVDESRISGRRMPYFYGVHGLGIASELELPELGQQGPSNDNPDVRVRLSALPPLSDLRPTSLSFLSIAGKDALLTFADAGRYLVRDGRDILIDVSPEADPALVRLFLFGPALGLICCQRGSLVLHASSVAFDGRVVAFTGPQGAGKSTLAAHSLAAGGVLMSDDFLVVSIADGGPALAHPGMPSVKLWRDALAHLGHDAEGLRPDWFRAEKFHVPASRAQTPLPLARLCVLELDEAADVGKFRRLSGAHALQAIVSNSFPPEYFEASESRELHFQQCASLARTIEVFELRQNRNLENLHSTAAMAKLPSLS